MTDIVNVIGIWVAGLFTLIVLSLLYKENPLFRMAEHIFIGLSAGYGLAVLFWNFRVQAAIPLLFGGRVDYLVPIGLGLLYYTQLSKKYSILYRLPLSIGIGMGLGVGLRSVMDAYFVRQIRSTFLPLTGSDPILALNNIIIVFGTVLVIVYFIFYKQRTGVWGHTTRIGRYILILSMGAIFGATVQGRMALLIQRFQFLVGDPAFPWRGLRMGTAEDGQWAWVAIPIFIVLFLGYRRWEATRPKKPQPPAVPTPATPKT